MHTDELCAPPNCANCLVPMSLTGSTAAPHWRRRRACWRQRHIASPPPPDEAEYLYAAYRLPSHWSTTVCAPCSGQKNTIVTLESVSNGSVG